jgi:hypothetical protein
MAVMRQGPRRAHLTVPELTCESCQALARELETARDINRRLAVENSKLVEDQSAAIERDRVQGNAIKNLRGQLTKQAKDCARREQIEAVVAHWRKHGRQTKFPEGGKNWATIEKALTLMAEDELGPVNACYEAIDGLHLAPYQFYDKRYATPGPGRDLRRDVEHALGDEVRIERCRRIARKARALPLDEKFRLFEHTKVVHEEAARVLMDALEERPDDVVEIDGIRTDVSPKEGSDDQAADG